MHVIALNAIEPRYIGDKEIVIYPELPGISDRSRVFLTYVIVDSMSEFII